MKPQKVAVACASVIPVVTIYKIYGATPAVITGLAVLAVMIATTDAAFHAFQALRYKKLERDIRRGQRGSGLAATTVDPEDETGNGFRVAGLSFDKDVRKSENYSKKHVGGDNVRKIR